MSPVSAPRVYNIPLMRDDPPRAAPCMTWRYRLPASCTGSDHQVEERPESRKMFPDTSGLRDIHVSATGPCSTTSTETLGSSESLEASTQPAVPPTHDNGTQHDAIRLYVRTSNDNVVVCVCFGGDLGRHREGWPDLAGGAFGHRNTHDDTVEVREREGASRVTGGNGKHTRTQHERPLRRAWKSPQCFIARAPCLRGWSVKQRRPEAIREVTGSA